MHERGAALAQGDDLSGFRDRKTISVFADDTAPLVSHLDPFYPQYGCDGIDDVQGLDGLDGCCKCGFACTVCHDPQFGRFHVGVSVAVDGLPHDFDGDAVLREELGDPARTPGWSATSRPM